MDISESLSTLATDFNALRKQKVQVSTHVLDILLQLAILLLKRYNSGQVIATLRITTVQLSQWCQALKLDEFSLFVGLYPQTSSTHPSVSLDLNLAFGEQIQSHGIDNHM